MRDTSTSPAPLRVGVLGLGVWGPNHAATAHGLPDLSLEAVVDMDSDRFTSLPAALSSVPRFTRLDDALEATETDAWIIASPTATHVPLARGLLELGKSVLLEKPLSSSLEEAGSLATLVADDSRNLMLGHSYLYGSEFLALEEEVRRRGSPVFIDCIRHRPLVLRDRFPDESPFHALMVHDLYLALALLDRAEPQRFSAQVHRGPRGVPDVTLAQLEWPDGTLASFTASFITPPGMPGDGYDRMEVYGEGWAVRIEPNPRPIEVFDERARWPLELEIRADASSPTGLLAEEHKRFARVVRGEAEVPVGASYTDAMTVQRWLDRLVTVVE